MPTELTGNVLYDKVILKWNPSLKGALPIAGYAIYKSTMPGKKSDTPLAILKGGNTYYIDYKIKDNVTYYYCVKAIDIQKNYSECSNEVKITRKSNEHVFWPMFLHDQWHSGESLYNGPEIPALKWKLNLNDQVGSSPAIGSDKTIYVGSNDTYLYAINPDGSLKWKFKTGGAIWSSPAIDLNGTIYFGSGDNNLYAINPDGSLKWKYKTGDGISSSPAIGPDGTVYFGSLDHYFYAIGKK